MLRGIYKAHLHIFSPNIGSDILAELAKVASTTLATSKFLPEDPLPLKVISYDDDDGEIKSGKYLQKSTKNGLFVEKFE